MKRAKLFRPAHKILVLIAYVQKPPSNAHADVSSGARSKIYSEPSTPILCVCQKQSRPPDKSM